MTWSNRLPADWLPRGWSMLTYTMGGHKAEVPWAPCHCGEPLPKPLSSCPAWQALAYRRGWRGWGGPGRGLL